MKFLMLVISLSFPLWATRIKDVAQLDGLEDIPLVGYGLVVGLQGTGDGTQSAFTIQTTLNLLRNMGIEVPNERLRLRNVAAVMVTSSLGPFNKKGSKLDVNISSMGDARSLEGGTLLMTPLVGPDQEIYALAQGPLSLGGILAQGGTGSLKRKNHTLSGQIPNGASIQAELGHNLALDAKVLSWSLAEPDFVSANNVAQSLNKAFGEGTAMAVDAATVRVKVPENMLANPVLFISQAEQVQFATNVNARVILNEKTGTVVAGGDVQISEIAVSHGNVTIEIQEKNEVSQPNALTEGRTASIINEQLGAIVEEAKDKETVKIMPSVQNANELAAALNALGVHPRDIIAIFQAIKKAGALHAELIIM